MDHYFETMRRLSNNQLLQIKYSLGAFFRHLEREYHFPNPVRQMEFDLDELKPFKRPIITLSRRDVLRFLLTLVSTAENFHRDLTIFCLIFATGCRISEILPIRMRQINFSHGLIILERTKSGKSQTVVLRQGMGTVLQFYCEHFNLSSDDYLFLNKYGRPIRYETARNLFKKYLLAARIPENHLHVTRHTFATHLFENGVDISIIQQLLRHRDKHTTVGYVDSHYVRNYGIKVSNNQKLYEKLSSLLS
jgi:integrase/recombinase XerD